MTISRCGGTVSAPEEIGHKRPSSRSVPDDGRATANSFPFDAWYMAAWSNEVGDGLFARRLLGLPVLIYRLGDGEAVACHDRCPHRFAPLSRGRKTESGVECAYHGLQFDAMGRCFLNPVGNGHVPANTRVRTYPLVERHRILWIWMGDAARADPELIPDFSLVPAEGVGHDNIGNYLHVKANYLLEIDNLMDLSHVNFLHLGSLGNESMRRAEVKVTEAEDTVRADLWMPNTICGFGEMTGQLCDQWNNIVWMPPTSMLLEFGAVEPGAPAAQDPHLYAFHILTPETERTTHYFFGTSACFSDADAWKSELIREAQSRAFLVEDNPMIEAVAESMGDADFWALRPAILPGDTAAIRVRRRLERMCRQDAGRSDQDPAEHERRSGQSE
jgi:phenylpropionate dioxygenase-like ring-hydroxylating dioxygenase large terminal subunit